MATVVSLQALPSSMVPVPFSPLLRASRLRPKTWPHTKTLAPSILLTRYLRAQAPTSTPPCILLIRLTLRDHHHPSQVIPCLRQTTMLPLPLSRMDMIPPPTSGVHRSTLGPSIPLDNTPNPEIPGMTQGIHRTTRIPLQGTYTHSSQLRLMVDLLQVPLRQQGRVFPLHVH